MHNTLRKNITVCFDYFYWNVILLNGFRCIKLMISLLKSSSSAAEKLRCPWWFSFIFIKLGWFRNFLIISVTDSLLTGSLDIDLLIKPKFFSTVAKHDVIMSATSLLYSVRVIYSFLPTLLEKKGLKVCQNCLLSVIFLALRLSK